jgi:D-amino-acid oxidase
VALQPNDARIPPEYRSAMVFRTALVEMEPYLEWLHSTVQDTFNVPIITSLPGASGRPQAEIWSLDNVSKYAKVELGARALVNCTGIGAREFSNDPALVPGRGVMVFAKRTPRHAAFNYCISEVVPDAFMTDGHLLAYAFPRGDGRLSLGGTYEEDNFSQTPTEAEVAGIRNRVGRLVPCLQEVEEISRWAGLRPVRHGGVRLEAQDLEDPDMSIVHNYGHGGGGVTTCWGCADEAVQLVQGALARSQ